jgi:hypothetical protein
VWLIHSFRVYHVPGTDMRLLRSFKRRFQTFDLLPEYFTAAGQRAIDILWGVALPFLIWTVYSLFKTPPAWINWTVILTAAFVAGYYVWRADHRNRKGPDTG